MTDCGLPSLGPGTRTWPETPPTPRGSLAGEGLTVGRARGDPRAAAAERAEHGDPATSAATPAPAAPDRPSPCRPRALAFCPTSCGGGPLRLPGNGGTSLQARMVGGGLGSCGSPPHPQLSEDRAPRGKNVWPELISPKDHKDSSSGCGGEAAVTGDLRLRTTRSAFVPLKTRQRTGRVRCRGRTPETPAGGSPARREVNSVC